jgi:acetyl/propionyl-CoA carboxylase alpha subunit
MRILVANRGEIARRVIRTAHRLGHDTVAVYSDPDRGMPHTRDATAAVRVGPADLAASYLSVERLLAAAAESGADAVHPGYGFLSENADFARAVGDAGLVWIGPNPDAIDAMGSKIEARRIAAAAGVPVIPGFDSDQSDDRLRVAADEIGYPILVKASAGGGGKGIRVVAEPGGFADALRAARDEARRSFGDDRVIIERYVGRPRHVEVQVVGDRHGAVVSLGTRECSVQRRYQKLLEEAPAPNLPHDVEVAMEVAAVALARRIGYDSAGTVEFVVDAESDDFYFLEMNTRLQVEHPVTEYVTGLDLVELQVRAAVGERLELDEVRRAGHAFEVRINAEDPTAGFAPQTGTITDLVIPGDTRWESGVEVGSEVTPYFDPMLAKLIVGGPDRDTARRRLAAALDGLLVGGVRTNAGFHRWLVGHPDLVEGRVTTRFLDEVEIPGGLAEEVAAQLAAAAWVTAPSDEDGGPWSRLGRVRFTPHLGHRTIHLQGTEDTYDVPVAPNDRPPPLFVVDRARRRVVVAASGHSHTFSVLTPTERWAPMSEGGHGAATAVVSPFPGVVAEVRVEAGGTVEPGQTVVVVEAMKMLHPLTAPGSGIVAELRVDVGDTVAGGQVLVTFESGGEER